MQHVLVHIDQGLGPVGAWSYTDDGRIVHFYPESLDTSISGRARLLMAQREDDITVPEWMDFIADSSASLIDDFETIEAPDDLSLTNVLSEFRRAWKPPD